MVFAFWVVNLFSISLFLSFSIFNVPTMNFLFLLLSFHTWSSHSDIFHWSHQLQPKVHAETSQIEFFSPHYSIDHHRHVHNSMLDIPSLHANRHTTQLHMPTTKPIFFAKKIIPLTISLLYNEILILSISQAWNLRSTLLFSSWVHFQ